MILSNTIFFQLGIYFLMPSSNDVPWKTFLEDFFQCLNLIVNMPESNDAQIYKFVITIHSVLLGGVVGCSGKKM